jgi:hypothetical protein
MAVPALINGINYSWQNNTLIIFGIPMIGISKIELMSEQEKENTYGYGVDPISRGYGNKKYEGSITLIYDELARIIAFAPGRDILDIPPFDIPLNLLNVKTGQLITATARMCEFTKHGYSANQNDKAIWVDMPLIVGRIDW